MPRPKGLAKTGGRQKGTRNKAPELRLLISQALERVGGVDYLARQAEANPGPFMALLGRLLPREMHAEISGELSVKAEVRRQLIDQLVILISHQTAAHQDGLQGAIVGHLGASGALPHMTAESGQDALIDGERGRAHASR